MEQAETIVTHRSAVLPISACARLRQGSSARATFVLEPAAGGTTITVGADPTCDWQIRAAFVPPQAFSLRLEDGEMKVQAGTAQSVLLNGKLVSDGWVSVPNGARIDVGLARVELTVGVGVGQYDAHRHRPVGFVASGPAMASTPIPRASLLDALPLTAQGVREAITMPPLPSRGAQTVPQAVLLSGFPEESGEFEVYQRRRDSSPALLERAEAAAPGAMRRYALVAAVTVCAYGGWLALLDFL